MEEKYSSRKLVEENIRNAHAFHVLNQLDRNQELEPYLYRHILEYQAYDPNVHTPEYAIKQNNVELVKYLISNDLWNIDEEDALGRCLANKSDDVFMYIANTFHVPVDLISSISSDDPSDWSETLTIFMIENYDPVENKDDEESNLEYVMIQNSTSMDMLNLLESSGWINLDMNKLLSWAAYNGQIDVVKSIIEEHTDEVDDYQKPLDEASRNGHLEIVQYFTESINHLDLNRALNEAALEGHLELLQYLVSNGADINRTKYLIYKCFLDVNRLDIAKYLIQQGVLCDIAFKQAARAGNLEHLQYLVDNGTFSDEMRKQYTTALSWASLRGYLNIVKYAIEHGADVTYEQNQPLRWAIEDEHVDVVQYLVNHGADANLALSFALRIDHAGIILDSIVNGADINSSEILQYAIDKGHTEIVKYLVEQGTDITFRNLYDAYTYKNPEIIKHLLDHTNSDILLSVAANIGKLDIVMDSIDRGANINVDDHKPIKDAAGNGHLDIVKYLISKGADSVIALSFAITGDNMNIVKYLVEEYGVNITSNDVLQAKDLNVHEYVFEQYYITRANKVRELEEEIKHLDVILENEQQAEDYKLEDYPFIIKLELSIATKKWSFKRETETRYRGLHGKCTVWGQPYPDTFKDDTFLEDEMKRFSDQLGSNIIIEKIDIHNDIITFSCSFCSDKRQVWILSPNLGVLKTRSHMKSFECPSIFPIISNTVKTCYVTRSYSRNGAYSPVQTTISLYWLE